MIIQDISLGQSFEDGVPRWQKLDIKAAPEPGETPQQVFDQIKTIIDGWHKERNPHLYNATYGKPPSVSDWPLNDSQVDKEFQELKQKLSEFEYREEALAYLETTTFKFSIEAKKIVNDKPSRSTN